MEIQLNIPTVLRNLIVSADHQTFCLNLGVCALGATLPQCPAPAPRVDGDQHRLALDDHLILTFALVPLFSHLIHPVSVPPPQGLYFLRGWTTNWISNIAGGRICENVTVPCQTIHKHSRVQWNMTMSWEGDKQTQRQKLCQYCPTQKEDEWKCSLMWTHN